MKFGKDSDQWPKDSLRRFLLKNGFSSVREALDKTKQPPGASQSHSDYETMRQIIIDIAAAFVARDYDKILSDEEKEEINNISISTIEGAIRWKEAWVRILKRQNQDF